MAIKIHHGPNGSYKTSGAIWDDAVPAAKEGRLIITNVRGVSRERFERLFDDLPDSFDVLFISHESSEGLERIRTWFQWAPRNAFLIFDEAQVIFPSKWSDKLLERFDFPGGPDKAKSEDKPTDWLSAWTMHRHFNWDVVLTMPNIKYLHTDIRGTSEVAYQHSNLALLGKAMKKLVGKDYKEAMHSAQENKAPTDGSNIVTLRKIDKRVFELYDSTATGVHRDTMAGKNALTSPRVLGLLGLLLGVFAFVIYNTGGHPFANPLASTAASPGLPANQATTYQSSSSLVHVAPNGIPNQPAVPPVRVDVSDPYSSFDITIKGSLWSQDAGVIYLFQMAKSERTFSLTTREMTSAGYTVFSRGTCAAELVYNGNHRTVACLGNLPPASGSERLGAERRAGGGGQSSPSQTADADRVVAKNSADQGNVAIAATAGYPQRVATVNGSKLAQVNQ